MITFVKRYLGIFIVIILSFWAIKPLFIPGFFPMHDDTQVARVFEMGKVLKDGVFPVRWVPDLGYGYGYPIFNFYAPLAYYVGGAFMLLGFDALIATKIMMGLGIILSGVFMYLLAREFWGELGGVASGIFYLYAPYHALDIYVRGDVAEFWAYAFLPLMFYGFYKVFNKSQIPNDLDTGNSKFKIQKFGIIGALGYAGIILSHNLTALMTTPFLLASFLILIIYSKKETRMSTTLYLILYTLLGLMLSAFYWVPALLEMRHTDVLSQVGGGADFRDHFVCLGQLWESNWGFGGSAPGCMLDGMSFVIGKLHILSFVLALILVGLMLLHIITGYSEKIKEKMAVVLISIFGFLISVFFMLEISKAVWEFSKPMEFFQYPWRFLLLASFFSSLLSGSIFIFLNKELFKKYGFYIAAVLILLLVNLNIKLFNPQTILPKTSFDYTNEYALKWTASKISDEFLPPDFKKPKSEYEIAKKNLEFRQTNAQKASNLISFIGIILLIADIIYLRLKKPINE